jgi:hypothetical protein
MIYSANVNLKPGSYSYKYYVNTGWSGAEWSDDYSHRTFEVVDSVIELNDTWANQSTTVNTLGIRIEVFPNPANSVITITSSEMIEEVKIYDLLGSLVLRQTVGDSFAQISTGGLLNGLHVVFVKTKSGVITRKIQIAK